MSENWYNDPFCIDNLCQKRRETGTDYSKYKYNKLRCTVAGDGRKQKTCEYYYRNSKTRKCLFLMGKNQCICEDT